MWCGSESHKRTLKSTRISEEGVVRGCGVGDAWVAREGGRGGWTIQVDIL